MEFPWNLWVEINIFAPENRPSLKGNQSSNYPVVSCQFQGVHIEIQLVTPLVHIPVPNVIVENKAEHVALPNEIYEHMYFVSGANFLFFHVIYIYIHIHIHTYIHTVSFNICLYYVLLCIMYQHLPSPFLNSRG